MSQYLCLSYPVWPRMVAWCSGPLPLLSAWLTLAPFCSRNSQAARAFWPKQENAWAQTPSEPIAPCVWVKGSLRIKMPQYPNRLTHICMQMCLRQLRDTLFLVGRVFWPEKVETHWLLHDSDYFGTCFKDKPYHPAFVLYKCLAVLKQDWCPQMGQQRDFVITSIHFHEI